MFLERAKDFAGGLLAKDCFAAVRISSHSRCCTVVGRLSDLNLRAGLLVPKGLMFGLVQIVAHDDHQYNCQYERRAFGDQVN